MSTQDAPPLGTSVPAALTLLRKRGERVTRARRAVLEVLDSTTEHLNADEIARRAAAKAPGVHRATVYRALSTLGELEMVRHTHVGGSAAVYHLAVLDPELGAEANANAHAHVRCTSCGIVLDVPAETLRPLVGRLERDLDFHLDPAHAALLGTCALCRVTAPTALA